MDPSNYRGFLEHLTATDEFAQLETAEQQRLLRAARDKFIGDNPDFAHAGHAIAADVNKSYLRDTGQGRYIPGQGEFEGVVAPWQEEGWEFKPDEEKEAAIAEFRTKIPEIAAQDTLNHEDRQYYLNESANAALRRSRGDDTGFVADKAFRGFEAFAANIFAGFGFTDQAEAIRNYVPDNPDYDEDFSAKLAAGAGDLLGSSAVFVGATLLTKNPTVGTGTLTATNSIRRFGDTYQQAIDMGLSNEEALDAGMASIPGAVVDAMGDKLIGTRFLPKGIRDKIKSAGNPKEKALLISHLLKKEGYRKSMMRVARDAFGEGASEAMGDLIGGYGAYLATDEEEFIPSKQEQMDSFLIGAILGGGVAGVFEGSGFRITKENGRRSITTKNQQTILDVQDSLQNPVDGLSPYSREERESRAFKFLREGKYKEAQELLKAPPEKGEPGTLIPPSVGQSTRPERTFNGETVQDLPEETTPEEEINGQTPFLPFDTGVDESGVNLSKYLHSRPETEEAQAVDAKLDEENSERARVKAEVKALGENNRNVSPEQASAVSRLLDTLAASWITRDTSRSVNDFYAKLNFKAVETLRPFNFIKDKFLSSVQDPDRDRRLGRATTFDQDGQQRIGVSRKADVSAVVHNMVGAMRATGIMEDILGADGMETIKNELNIEGDIDFDGDQKIGDALLDWINRQEPSDTKTSSLFQSLKDWIKDTYQALQTVFGPSEAREALDAEFAKLFSFSKIQPLTVEESLGRSQEEINIYSQQQQELGQTVPTPSASDKGETKTTPRNAALKQAAIDRANESARAALDTPDAPREVKHPRRFTLGRRRVVNPDDFFEPGVYGKAVGWDRVTSIMPISHFLNIAQPLARTKTKARDLAEQGVKWNDPISLTMSVRGGEHYILGHEGRNRATYLASQGYTHIPVVIATNTANIRWPYQAEFDPDDSQSRYYYLQEWPTMLRTERGHMMPFPLDRYGNWTVENIPTGTQRHFTLSTEDVRREMEERNRIENRNDRIRFAAAVTGFGAAMLGGGALIFNSLLGSTDTNTTINVGETSAKPVSIQVEEDHNFRIASEQEVAEFVDEITSTNVSVDLETDSMLSSFLDEFNDMDIDAIIEDYLANENGENLTNVYKKDGSRDDQGRRQTYGYTAKEYAKAVKELRDLIENFDGDTLRANLGSIMGALEATFGKKYDSYDLSNIIEPNSSPESTLLRIAIERGNRISATGASYNLTKKKININFLDLLRAGQPKEGWDIYNYMSVATLGNELTHLLQGNEEKGDVRLVPAKTIPITAKAAGQFSRHLDLYPKLGIETETESFEGSYAATKAVLKRNGESIFPDYRLDPSDYMSATMYSLSNTERVGGRIQAASKGVQFYYNLPTYSFNKNGSVSLGKLTSSKTGEVSVAALGNLQGFDGTQLKKSELQFYKRVASHAFTDDGKVNLRDLIRELESAPPVVEVLNTFEDQSSDLDDQEAIAIREASMELGALQHEFETEAPGWILTSQHVISPDNKEMSLVQASKPEPEGRNLSENAQKAAVKFWEKSDKLTELISRRRRRIRGQIEESFSPRWDNISVKEPEDMENYVEMVVRLDEDDTMVDIRPPGGQRHFDRSIDTSVVVHVRGYTEWIGDKKYFMVLEVRSDWSKQKRDTSKHNFLEIADRVRYTAESYNATVGETGPEIVLFSQGNGGMSYFESELGLSHDRDIRNAVYKHIKPVIEKKYKEEVQRRMDMGSYPEGSNNARLAIEAQVSAFNFDINSDPELVEAFKKARADYRSASDHLVDNYNEIGIKAAVQFAKRNGHEAIAVADTATALMAQGHDSQYRIKVDQDNVTSETMTIPITVNPYINETEATTAENRFRRHIAEKYGFRPEYKFQERMANGQTFYSNPLNPSIGYGYQYSHRETSLTSYDLELTIFKIEGIVRVPTRWEGMNNAYGKKLPKILKKITKSKPEPVNFGSSNRESSSLIGADGEFKYDVTANSFELNNVSPTSESLFRLQTNEAYASRPLMLGDKPIRNAAEALEWLEQYDKDNANLGVSPIIDMLKLDPKLREYLKSVKVVKDKYAYFEPNGNYIAFTGAESNIDVAHELTHALLDSAIQYDPEFKSRITELMSEVIDGRSTTSTKIRRGTYEAFVLYNEQKSQNPGMGFEEWFAINHHSIQSKINERTGLDLRMGDMRNIYALMNPHEFITAVMSDHDFRAFLESNYATDNRSFFRKFLDYVMELMGIDRSESSTLKKLDDIIRGEIQSGQAMNYLDMVFRGKPLRKAQNRMLTLQQSQDGEGTQNPNKKNIEVYLSHLNSIRRGTISDRGDKHTALIRRLLKSINPKEVLNLSAPVMEKFFEYTENIYRARSRRVQDPAIRIDTEEVLHTLQTIKRNLDDIAIANIIESYDSLVDFNLFEGDWSNRAELEAFVSEAAQAAAAAAEAEKTSRGQARRSKQDDNWRTKYAIAQAAIINIYSSAEQWIQDFEAFNGKIKSKTHRDFLMMHYDYLTQLADVESMSGVRLYNHYHSINNLLDGRLAYAPETTVKHIQALRDSQIDRQGLEEKFRDPMVWRQKYLKSIDEITRSTELMQTQLERWSAFIDGKNFLQEDLMGPIFDAIVRESENNRMDAQSRYTKKREEVERTILGRNMNGSDRAVMAMVNRLIQFEVTEDSNTAILRNIENERQSFENAEKRASRDVAKAYRERLRPMFDQLIENLENSDTPYQDFMDNIEERAGLGDFKVGQGRMELLYEMMDIMNEFRVDQETISEMFYKKPFRAYVNYMPLTTIPTDASKASGEDRSVDLAAPIEEFEGHNFQTRSMTAIPSQLQERKGAIGQKRYYSNNIENIFDRGLRMSSIAASTTAERFILKERLKIGNPISDLILGEEGTEDRVEALEGWAKDLIYNSMYNGEPLNELGVIMKTVNEAYARVALSGVHQGVTQTIAGFTDYEWRTGNITGAMQAASYFLQHREKMNEWFTNNLRWIANRDTLGEAELNRQKTLIDDDSLKSNPAIQRLESIYKGAGTVITASLRAGDSFTAKSLVLAEYVRLMKSKGYPIDDITSVDWDTVDGNLLTQATINVERNVNASNKVLRGQLFTDRKKMTSFVRNVFFAFSTHVMTLAAQMNMAVRDAIELKMMGASPEEIRPKIKTIGAIIAQTVSFSTGRYIINGSIATAILALLRELYDDEEGKIAELELAVQDARDSGDRVSVVRAEQELREARAIRKRLNTFKDRTTSFDSFFKSVVREELSVVHWAFNGPGLPQKLIFMYPDHMRRNMLNEEADAQIAYMDQKIRELKKNKKYAEAARLSEQKTYLEDANYIPWNYENFGNLGFGGITGTSFQAIYSSLQEAMGGATQMKEWNLSDAILAAQSSGLGQADILRFFREVDRIEDDIFKSRQGLDEKIDAASKAQIEAKRKERDKQIESMIRQLYR